MKKKYIKPEVFLVGLGDIMDVINPGSPTLDPDAKENDFTFDDWDWDNEDEDLAPYRSLWAE